MNREKEPTIDEVIIMIRQCQQRMKHAKEIKDKIGYEIALKEHERLHKQYEHILYGQRIPSKVFEKNY